MANYKDRLSGTFRSISDKVKEVSEAGGVKEIYARGAERAKSYARAAKLSLAINGETEELRKVYTEIGKLYFEQNRDKPEGYFAPLFSQADLITEAIHAKQDEIDTLKAAVEAARNEPDIDVEIADFEQIVNATEADGTQTGPDSGPEA